MHNRTAETIIADCNCELERIGHLIEGFGSTSPVSGFLTKYVLMRVSGTLERAYKTIIADHYKAFSTELEQFIDHNVHDANMNACYDNICKMLKAFDSTKIKAFKAAVHGMPSGDNYIVSFSELNNVRNNVLHGGTLIPSFSDLKKKYEHSLKIIEVLDAVM